MTKALYTIVGMQHRPGATEMVASLPAGEPITLIRDANNEHDPNAVQVWARDLHIGFVKAKEVGPLARAMDRAVEMQQFSRGGGRTMTGKFVVSAGWPSVELDE